MARWKASFENGQLVVRRGRWLPWLKAHVRRIPLATVVDIGSLTLSDLAKRRAQVTVQNPSAPHLPEVIPVRFTPEQWEVAAWFVRERRGAPTQRPQQAPPRPAADVPAQRRAQPPAALQAHVAATPPTAPTAADPTRKAADPTRKTADPSRKAPDLTRKTADPSRKATASTAPVMRAGDGKRSVWLWSEGEQVHGSLVPVGNVAARQLSAADVAELLLAEPYKAMPAIRALTGVADRDQALARIRSWRANRVVVNLSASDLAGRRVTGAMQKPGRSNPDGSVRTVSGGLPSINKRRR
ncbi:hypothetical protein [Verrucosispora sp. ts21]|uniref:hypothetical protein n=1 Tax=Verrucosispora sp. ts21 TaxID=2069341 RepID=UPI001E65B37E|nr:hypothetical protein [Verrucosispora sp. ts21]